MAQPLLISLLLLKPISALLLISDEVKRYSIISLNFFHPPLKTLPLIYSLFEIFQSDLDWSKQPNAQYEVPIIFKYYL